MEVVQQNELPPSQQTDLQHTKPHQDISTAVDPPLLRALDEEAVTDSEETLLTDDNAIEDDGVRDLGWNSQDPTRTQRVTGSMDNEDIWMLIRRFNKQVFHVKTIAGRPPNELDLNTASNEDLTPEKLEAHMERLYMTLAISLLTFQKHFVRIRSWRESDRTLCFFIAYASAWTIDFVVPTALAFLIVLVLYPSTRSICFPHEPLYMVESTSGRLNSPASGPVASSGSITGAPEKHRGEAVEQEAHNFAKSVGKLFMDIGAGKYSQQHPNQDPPPDQSHMRRTVNRVRDLVEDQKPKEQEDEARAPVARTMDKVELRPALRQLPNLIDTWERLANALSPTWPFALQQPKVLIATGLGVLFLLSCLTSWNFVMRALQFVVGSYSFGAPVIARAMVYVKRLSPDWQSTLVLRDTLLKGVPTNAQLTITILRLAERNNAPLPPPPDKHQASGPKDDATARDYNTSDTASEDVPASAGVAKPEESLPDTDDSDKNPHSHPHRIVHRLKRTTQSGIRAILRIHEAKEKLSSSSTSRTIGVLDGTPLHAGPVRFAARYKGKKGHAFVTTTATTSALSWRSEVDDLDLAWTVAIDGIDDLKKTGAFGWKSKFLIPWTMDRGVPEGMTIGLDGGESYMLEDVSMRDELFNRLVSIGGQMWELW